MVSVRPRSRSAPRDFGQLRGVPGPLLGELVLHEGLHLLGDTRRVPRSGLVGQALRAALLPAVEVPPDARLGAPGVSGDTLQAPSPARKAQNLGAQTHFGLEVGVLLDLSQPDVLFGH